MWFDNHFDYRKKYYLSGPMNGYPEHNFPAFEEASRQLREAGIEILSAHEVVHPEPTILPCETCDGSGRETVGLTCPHCGWDYSAGDKPKARGALLWSDYLKTDLIEMLTHTQGIILLKGWPQSEGAKMEVDVALKLGWPVYYYENLVLTCMNKDGHND